MTLNRRDFVASVGWSFLASAAARADAPKPAAAAGAENFSDWPDVRAQWSVLPEIVGGLLEHHVDAALAVPRIEEVLHHGDVLRRLFLVPGACLGGAAGDVAHL